MLELLDVKKVYKTKVGDTNALNGLTVTLPDKGLVFVTGKSGCGKTTLLNCVGGLDGIDGGDIVIDGKRFSEFSVKDYDSYRNTFIGFVFQEYNLLPDYNIEKNIKIATELQGIETTKETIDEILKMVDLEGLNLRKPSELSGGQKQRVAIARALVKNPKIIMADEPTGALDSATGIQVMETLQKLSKTKLVMIVSHDLELAEKFADRIIRLVDGRLVEDVTLTDKEITANIYDEQKGLIVKMGSDLSSAETASLVQAIRDSKNIKFIKQQGNIAVRTKEPTPPIKAVHPANPVQFVNSKMKYKSSAGLGLRSLKVKPIRLAFTILLSVIAFALFGIFDTIASYNNTRIVANLLRSGDYNSLVLENQYSANNDIVKIRVPQSTIDTLNKKSGHNFRGLYEISDKNAGGVSTGTYIETLEDAKSILTGSEYFYKIVDDFIEFNEQTEIKKGSGIVDGYQQYIIDPNGFNFKLYGKYPTLPSKKTDSDGFVMPLTMNSFSEIAISNYTANSIIYWLQKASSNGVAKINGKTLTKATDLIGMPINLDNSYREGLDKITYVITGIVDVGTIPTKYDSLKNAYPDAYSKNLADDLATHIYTNAYLKVFVPTGYVKEWREYNNRKNVYFGGGNSYVLQIDDTKRFSLTFKEQTAFYNYDNDFIGTPNVLFFNGEDGEQPVLNKNEVLISANDFISFYQKEINAINSSKIGNIIQTINRKDISALLKQTAFEQLKDAFKNKQNLNKKVVLESKSVDGQISNLELKIVGLYVNVNDDLLSSGLYKYGPLMTSNKTLQGLGVCTQQGEFARIISTSNTKRVYANALAEEMTSADGHMFIWYNNSVLTDIESNKVSLQKFSELFLYVSIVLALFSIFMLFNYISTSIVSKRPSIGVLRALGSNGRDVFRMFITESLIISIINGVLASVATAIGCIFVNQYIRNTMNMTIDFAIFGIRQIVVIILISIVTGIVSSILPIIKICKEKPVDLIRKL